jgi:hypothetical protein
VSFGSKIRIVLVSKFSLGAEGPRVCQLCQIKNAEIIEKIEIINPTSPESPGCQTVVGPSTPQSTKRH